MTTINDIWTAYDDAESRWTGCDWPTHFGCLDLNLDGISANQASDNAGHWAEIAVGELADDDITRGDDASLVGVAQHLRITGVVVCLGGHQGDWLALSDKSARVFCAEALAKEWRFATEWLEEVESDAAWAEQEAQRAVGAAEDGNWDEASAHAARASAIESEYRHGAIWKDLRETIETVANNSRESHSAQPSDLKESNNAACFPRCCRYNDNSRGAQYPDLAPGTSNEVVG
jgi:hypothetical protein